MKLAIMQPYFFHYVGYFQLAYMVDQFVFLDDVGYIKNGFINRNKILLEDKSFRFSIPIINISSNRNINEHKYSGNFSLFLKQITAAYRKAPNFDEIYALIENICFDPDLSVSGKNSLSVRECFRYLGVKFETEFSSEIALDKDLRGQDRVISICKLLKATNYVNSVGGQELYSETDFIRQGIELSFKEANIKPYKQYSDSFIEGLSIIDLLMFNKKDIVLDLLS